MDCLRHALPQGFRTALAAVFLLVLRHAPGDEPSPRRSAEVARPPNFLVILADDLGFSDLGCYGGEIRTPHLDRLAAGGLRFRRFYNTGRCWPTRSALMTGYYPQQVRMDPPAGRLPSWATPLPQRLRPLGYRSYLSGKWHVPGAPRARADAGFDRTQVLEDHDRNFHPRAVTEDDVPLPPVAPGTGYYTATAQAEFLIRCLEDHAAHHGEQPFFAYLAFTVPHFPLQAPADVVEQYADTYRPGWDAIREERFQRLRRLGLARGEATSPEGVVPRWNLPEAELQSRLGAGEVGPYRPWNQLTGLQQEFQARKMAVHAAMIDTMDRAIGRVIERLRAAGWLDHTVVLFASDNGASAEQIIRGDGHAPGAAAGSAESYLCLGPGWSAAANSPFRRHKSWVHEGGVATPLIVHWPAGIRARGAWRDDVGHVIDVVPTLLELAGGTAPAAPGGPPLAGRSFAPALRGTRISDRPPLYFHHDGNRALLDWPWKVVSGRPGNNKWHLHHLGRDRVEAHDLAGRHPGRTAQLVEQWEALDRQFRAEAGPP